MPYLYLIGAVIFVASESITGGLYNSRNSGINGASSLYSLIKISSVFLFWSVLFFLDFKIGAGVIWYAVLFAFCFALCSNVIIRALKTGPILLTSLFLQLSLIGTTTWGFFFWDTQFTVLVAVGLILVVIAIVLCLYSGKNVNVNEKISLKWIIYVVLMFLSNAGCSIVQKTQQLDFGGEYGNFLMWVASGISVIFCLVVYLKDDHSRFKVIFKSSGYIPIISGVLNGGLNLFVILLATSILSPSLIYPVIGVGGLIIMTLFSTIVFKEKMRWWQWVGIVLGMTSVAILSI